MTSTKVRGTNAACELTGSLCFNGSQKPTQLLRPHFTKPNCELAGSHSCIVMHDSLPEYVMYGEISITDLELPSQMCQWQMPLFGICS